MLKSPPASFILGVFLVALTFTRFINLGWGLPFPFHPDERNMADAITRLSCNNFPIDCFHPHFFAYGQLPLYLAYFLVKIYYLLMNIPGQPSFEHAVIALRTISAAASVLMMLYLLKLIRVLMETLKLKVDDFILYALSLIFIFSPGLIQFAHFGTTETLLMLFYTAITYISVLILQRKLDTRTAYIAVSVLTGLAVGTKISALTFMIVPLIAICINEYEQKKSLVNIFFVLAKTVFNIILVSFIASPYNLAAYNDFISSITYESMVGLGTAKVFYTQQFQDTIPLIFQFIKVFPYALGIPVLLMSLIGFFALPWRKELVLVRIAIVCFLILNAGLYTKWTRFMAPIFPLFLIFAALTMCYVYKKWFNERILFLVISIVICVVPGIAYLSVYMKEDVRMQATRWIQANIPEGSIILQDGGNVIDLPLPGNYGNGDKNFRVISFNFYDLDNNPQSNSNLSTFIEEADYIIVPSRRVFANFTCMGENIQKTTLLSGYLVDHCKKISLQYPLVNQYFGDLFSGKLMFQPWVTFNSYPAINFLGQEVFTLPDENAEETWTVFDHPVIRIYKKTTQ